MSAEIINTADGILTVKMSGRLAQGELAGVQQQAAELLRPQSKTAILVLAENFQGWERGGDWNDLAFQMENDRYIKKLAIVGDRKWEDLALLFAAKGIRKFPIEYFPPDQAVKARAWLKENP